MKKKLQVALFAILVLASLLAACGGEAPEVVVVTQEIVVTATPEQAATPEQSAPQVVQGALIEETPTAEEVPAIDVRQNGNYTIIESVYGTVQWEKGSSMTETKCDVNTLFKGYDEVYFVYPGLDLGFPSEEIPPETMATWCGRGNADNGFTWIAPFLDFLAIFSEGHDIPKDEFWNYQVDIITVDEVETVTMEELIESDPQVPLTIGVNWTD